MYSRLVFMTCAAAVALSAQNFSRRADIRGGGDPGRGKCTIEVVVDGAVEVEIRGDNAFLRNLNGQPPQWRRFVCNAPMPNNPRNFRFAGVDGRGRQSLLRDPGNGGAAVVRIEDPDNGSEGYTFDIFWEGQGGGGGGDYRPQRPGYGRDEAVRACQDAISQQARDRFRGANVNFRQIDIDNSPGRRDWVVGTIDVRRESFRFSCSVDFQSGRIRSAQIEDNGGGGNGGGGGGFNSPERAIRNCRRAVEDRLASDGFDRVDFNRVDVDDRPGRRDSVVGDARADGRNGRRSFDFSCSVNLGTGEVRNVDVQRR